MSNFPYERLIQWLAGPLAALIAFGATELVHSTISHSAALNLSTFVATAFVTYLAHHKWLDNLPKWWSATIPEALSEELPQSVPSAVSDTETVLDDKPETARTPDAVKVA